jgi:hypothetical protein
MIIRRYRVCANTRLELAFRVAGLVYDEVGGDPGSRPKEFL